MSENASWVPEEAIQRQEEGVSRLERAMEAARKRGRDARIGALACGAGAAGLIAYDQSPWMLFAATSTAGLGYLYWKIGESNDSHAEESAERRGREADILESWQPPADSEIPTTEAPETEQ